MASYVPGGCLRLNLIGVWSVQIEEPELYLRITIGAAIGVQDGEYESVGTDGNV